MGGQNATSGSPVDHSAPVPQILLSPSKRGTDVLLSENHKFWFESAHVRSTNNNSVQIGGLPRNDHLHRETGRNPADKHGPNRLLYKAGEGCGEDLLSFYSHNKSKCCKKKLWSRTARPEAPSIYIAATSTLRFLILLRLFLAILTARRFAACMHPCVTTVC